MKLIGEKARSSAKADERAPSHFEALKAWLFSWELYLILGLAAFLRFYLLQTTEFDDDQAIVFRMAHDAISHGLLVATSNIASIGIVNPPAVIYFLMLPATLSANPLGGAILVALCNTLAVILCYIFTRRYYGRLAATIAALLFATSNEAVYYSRFIWQQNLLPLFVMLFIFTLFLGVVDRRKGWLFPAIVLLGLLIQLHASTIMLSVALIVALALAPGTLRWRDLALGLAGLFVIYFPYLLWELASKFHDVHILLTVSKRPTLIDTQALTFYQLFLSPYNPQLLPRNSHALIYLIQPWLAWLPWTMIACVIGGLLLALLQGIWPRQQQASGSASASSMSHLKAIRNWWGTLRATPERCGLLVLLTWQLIPLLTLFRHSIDLYPHYFIFFLPGQFILIGFFLARTVGWFKRFRQWGWGVHYAIVLLTACITIAQYTGSLAAIIDYEQGYYSDRQFATSYYNDLISLQSAVRGADQVAQRNHLNHVYISTDLTTQTALRYLAEQMQTPVTLFDDSRCLVLPNQADGPAVMLVGPYSAFTETLLAHFAIVKLVDEPLRLDGPPFHLYIVTPASYTATRIIFVQQLHLLSTPSQQSLFTAGHNTWYVTRWSMLHDAAPSYRTLYSYQLQETPDGLTKLARGSQCILTSMRAGDQLLVAFHVPPAHPLPASFITFTAQFYQTSPYNLSYGPVALETDINRTTQHLQMRPVRYSLGNVVYAHAHHLACR
jgi:4-amino-4-deoxy-L-arabinose transferase-like glycosyltransferase